MATNLYIHDVLINLVLAQYQECLYVQSLLFPSFPLFFNRAFINSSNSHALVFKRDYQKPQFLTLFIAKLLILRYYACHYLNANHYH